jgi:hypothetical protein
MNPNLARQGARGRENMMPPTSIMDERYPAFKRNQEDVEKLMLGLDIVGSAIPLAGPAAKGAVALGKYSAPQIAQALENYTFKTGMALPVAPIGPKKQALIDAGYYHPIGGGKKLEVPISEMLFTAQENTPKVARTIISPESMQGSTIIPAVGDRTAAGMLLTDIGGKPLNSPVQLEGGADFMRTHAPYGAAWASDKGVITALSKKVREAGEKGDVYMPHVAMSHTSGDFSNMMADALLEQMRATNISKTAKLEFDRSMRKVRPEWKGIDDPETLADMKSNGAIRTAFVAEANLDKYANKGFPSIARTRVAITDPNLMDVPIHSTGYTVAKMNPQGLVIDQPQAPHGSYSHQLGGTYAGGFEKPIPRDIMFPNFYAKRRAMGADVAGDMRSFQLGNPVQVGNQQWLDGVMRYLQGR